MKNKLGIAAACLSGVKEIDALDLIRDVGFESVFSEDNDPKTVLAIREKCDRLGLVCDSLHAPWRGINDIWLEGDACKPLLDGIYLSVDAAAGAGIPAIVTHVSSGWFPPKISEIGYERFAALVDYAEKKKVKLAFENLRRLGHLAVLMDLYERNPWVGFCYDWGHEHCYTETVKYLDFYGDRLLVTHIHDNFGRDHNDYYADPDAHLMPFDGNIDYADIMTRLRKTDYTGSLTLELFREGKYAETPDREYLEIAFERLQRIAALGK